MINKILSILSNEDLLKKVEKLAKLIGFIVVITNGLSNIICSLKELIDSIFEWLSNSDERDEEDES